MSRIHDFTAQRPIESQWFMLEFSTLGFIGKLFRSSDLPLLAQFIALFHREKPVDWLLDLLFVNRYCHPEKSPKQCSEVRLVALERMGRKERADERVAKNEIAPYLSFCNHPLSVLFLLRLSPLTSPYPSIRLIAFFSVSNRIWRNNII